MNKRFTLNIEAPEEGDGEVGFFILRNRAGRAWRSVGLSDMESLCEQAAELEDFVNNGGKLPVACWEDYEGAFA